MIGADADEARLGGYSGPGIHKVSILDGIREKLGRTAAVRFVAGPGRVSREVRRRSFRESSARDRWRSGRGLRGEYFDNNRLEGQPRVVAHRRAHRFRLDAQLARRAAFRSTGTRRGGRARSPLRAAAFSSIGIEGNDGYRLWIDDRLVIDNWRKESYGRRMPTVNLARGTEHAIRLEYFESTGNARLKLVWDAGVANDWRAQIDSAFAAAARSDVAVVVAGLEEGEFRDRAFLKLPGHQEELIERVAAAGKPVVVVLVGGSAITMSRWLDRVDAVIDVWYPGEEGGHAVADVLFGDANPAGRLPITFPMSEGQLPLVYNHKPTGRGDDYLDLTGQPLFPFGFGLSYTTFEYSNLAISPADMPATARRPCAAR